MLFKERPEIPGPPRVWVPGIILVYAKGRLDTDTNPVTSNNEDSLSLPLIEI